MTKLVVLLTRLSHERIHYVQFNDFVTKPSQSDCHTVTQAPYLKINTAILECFVPKK